MPFFKKSDSGKANKPESDIEKIQKDLKFAGVTVSIVGWVNVFNVIGFYVWSRFDSNFILKDVVLNDPMTIFLELALAISFIIFGNKIRIAARVAKANDIKSFLYIIFVETAIFTLGFLASGRGVGIIVYLMLLFLVVSMTSADRMIKLQKTGQ